jgi:hypothetical protein
MKEALSQAGPATTSFEPRHLEATYRGDGFTWNQYLNYSEVNGVVYFDEGNGIAATNAPAAINASNSSGETKTGGARTSASH